MRRKRLIGCVGVSLMVLAGCESRPVACESTPPGPLSPELMQEPRDLIPLLDTLIQPYEKDSSSSGGR